MKGEGGGEDGREEGEEIVEGGWERVNEAGRGLELEDESALESSSMSDRNEG
jgi:hypothetical protein